MMSDTPTEQAAQSWGEQLKIDRPVTLYPLNPDTIRVAIKRINNIVSDPFGGRLARTAVLNIGAAVRASLRPVAVPPVNEIALIFGCSTMSCPTFGPRPWRMLSTPGGTPASIANSDKR